MNRRTAFTLVELPVVRKGFTLVELLVVVAIIVVLLALLMPALDRAIYHAEMAACAARQRGIATGATSYASENNRKYPHRETMNGGWVRGNNIASSWSPTTDDRPYLRNYMSLKILLDPFAGGIDLEATQAKSHVFSNYELWFGMRYTTALGGKGMYKIGDRMEWDKKLFNVLVSCEDKTWPGTALHDAHPDADGVTSFHAYQDEGSDDFPLTGNPEVDGYYTLSRWSLNGSAARGTVDLNYTFQDGAVVRFDGVLNDEYLNPDSRMEKVPVQGTLADSTTNWSHLPLR